MNCKTLIAYLWVPAILISASGQLRAEGPRARILPRPSLERHVMGLTGTRSRLELRTVSSDRSDRAPAANLRARSVTLESLAAEPGISNREREAMIFLASRLKSEYSPDKYEVRVSPKLVQTRGNSARPISGQRPVLLNAFIELKEPAKEKGFWKGVKRVFDRTWHKMAHRKSQWSIQVTEGSVDEEAVERVATTLFARLKRRLPINERVHDFVHSRGVRTGAAAGAIGAIASSWNLPVAFAAVGWAVVEVKQGLENREVARQKATEGAVRWAQESIDRGVTPTPAETFSAYKYFVDQVKTGTTAGTMSRFMDRLAVHGL